MNCHEDALGIKQPVLYSDGFNYFLQAQTIEQGAERTVLYSYNDTEGLRKKSISSAAAFAAPSPINQPIIYHAKRHDDQPAKWINAKYESSANRTSRSTVLINNILDGAQDDFATPIRLLSFIALAMTPAGRLSNRPFLPRS